MAFLSSLNISGSALTAQKLRMEIISQNIANANTTRTEEGGPYHKKTVVFKSSQKENSFNGIFKSVNGAKGPAGVVVTDIIESEEGLKPVYNPSHPDADENGYVMMPNVNTVEEMIDMISATRSYEAGITAMNAVKLMALRALDIGR
jgi:flagellar basal-body rod protein FlgC